MWSSRFNARALWRLSGLHRKMKNPRRSYSSFSISKMRWGSTYWFLSESLVSSDLRGSNTQRCIERVEHALPCLTQTVLQFLYFRVCAESSGHNIMVSFNFPDIDRLDVAMTCCDNTFVRFCLGQVQSLRASETAAAQKVQELQQLLAEAFRWLPTKCACTDFVFWYVDFMISFGLDDFLTFSFHEHVCFSQINVIPSYLAAILVEKMQPRYVLWAFLDVK